MYGLIYKVTGKGGKIYIGQTTYTLAHRKGSHIYRAKKGDQRSAFQIALLEEGFSNFTWEEIDTAETQEEMDVKEKKWIAFYKSNNPKHGYNIASGGVFFKHSEETKRKIGLSNKNPSPELRERRKKWMTGRIVSDETRHKISESHKGSKQWCAKLTEDDVRQIKIDLAKGESHPSIAKRYGVDRSIISGINIGKIWRHVV
jgi:group I intron endonuclease